MTDKIYSIEEIKKIVKPIAEKYKADKVWLFGSYARGEATNKSDIDLFIENLPKSMGLTFCNMYSDFEESLEKNVDIITNTCTFISEHSKQTLLSSIRKDRKILYEQK